MLQDSSLSSFFWWVLSSLVGFGCSFQTEDSQIMRENSPLPSALELFFPEQEESVAFCRRKKSQMFQRKRARTLPLLALQFRNCKLPIVFSQKGNFLKNTDYLVSG